MDQSKSTNNTALGIGSAVVIIGVIVFLVMMNRPSGSAGAPTGIKTLPNIVPSAPGTAPGIAGAPAGDGATTGIQTLPNIVPSAPGSASGTAGNGAAGSQVPPTIPWKSQAGQDAGGTLDRTAIVTLLLCLCLC